MTAPRGALVAVALGGGLGGLARYGALLLVPGLWGTLLVNVLGCALIGVLMAFVPRAHPLTRPFLGVGVLGGFTTFSAYAVDVVRTGGVVGLAYLGLTPVAALTATGVALAVTRRVVG